MKKNFIKILLIMLPLTYSSMAFSEKVNFQSIEDNYTKVIILDKGIKRTLLIPKDDSLKTKAIPYSAEQINAREGLIINFLDDSLISIEQFEEKYGLKLKTKFLKNYYIFENISKNTDIQIINQIIQNETNIKTIKPNWRLQNTPK